MKRFMAMLHRHKAKEAPPGQALELAGQLCRRFQSPSPALEQLVGAIMACKHAAHFLSNVHVVRACVWAHVRRGEHTAARRLLECCQAEEKEELLQLWYEIHYQQVMEKQHTAFLTPLQRFRCRKRNPPPVSLCPEGLKNRNYPDKVRQQLHRFAAEVTPNPNKEQREELAQVMNLQPTQVYNWFANYRRRQKSRLACVGKLSSSRPKEALTHPGAKEQQSRWPCTPQTADGSYVGLRSEQMGMTLLPSEPGWEHSAADLDKSHEGAYLKMLQSSFTQTGALCEARTSEALPTARCTEPPGTFCSEAVLEPGTCFGPAALQSRGPPSRGDASSRPHSFVLCSYGSPAFPGEELAAWSVPPRARGASGSMWTPSTEAGFRAALSRVPQGGSIEASSGSIIAQSDLEDESFILREEQLGTLEALLPHSSSQAVFSKPQCPLVSAPYVEESQALGHSQVPEDPAGDPSASDTYQAAWLLFEFSSGGRM